MKRSGTLTLIGIVFILVISITLSCRLMNYKNQMGTYHNLIQIYQNKLKNGHHNH